MRLELSVRMAGLVAWSILTAVRPVAAQQIPLRALVTPSTVIIKDGHPVTFAVHGFIEFESLAELFPYIESQAKRWQLSRAEAQAVARGLLRRGIESREIWKVKFLELARFGEVIRSIPDEIRLEHFLNDGDSPDIPIPVYVGYLNRIRKMASVPAVWHIRCVLVPAS